MSTKVKKNFRLLAVFLLAFLLAGCGAQKVQEIAGQQPVNVSDGSADMAATAAEIPDAGTEKEISEEKTEESVEEPMRESPDPGDEGQAAEDDTEDAAPGEGESGGNLLPEEGSYSSKEDVAEYLYRYGHLPPNFITKKEAQALGWEGGSLEPFAPGKCIGGSHFGNYEELLPEKEGRVYTECDIDTLGADSRGAKRIVFSNDGLIYYTEDHYQSFELLYGEE